MRNWLTPIRERLETITDGPWVFVHTDDEKAVYGKYNDGSDGAEVASWIPYCDVYCESPVYQPGTKCGRRGVVCGHEEKNQQYADSETTDATFIAHAPSDIRRLLDAVERVQDAATDFDLAAESAREGLNEQAAQAYDNCADRIRGDLRSALNEASDV